MRSGRHLPTLTENHYQDKKEVVGDRWQNQFLVRRLVLLLPLVLLAFGSAEAGGPAHNPGATATAWAIRVSPANASSAASPSITSPPAAAPSAGSFTFPSDGSIVRARVDHRERDDRGHDGRGSARRERRHRPRRIFNGEITADAVTARASAGTGPSGAGGNANGSGVSNLVVNGAPVSSGRVPLGDWGQLTISAQGIDRSAPEGALGYRGFVTVLDIHLTADHGGLPANSEIQIGYAEAAAQTAPPAAPAVDDDGHRDRRGPDDHRRAEHGRRAARPPEAQRATDKNGPLNVHAEADGQALRLPGLRPGRRTSTRSARAGRTSPTTTATTSSASSASRSLAVADGTIFSVGWNKIGGNRLWLLDEKGNQFYYAHLSAFATTNGAHVRAGQVVGFMGNTGDAEGTPYHLHFEVHPVSLLYLGYDGAVDPTPYLDAWSHQQDLPFPIAAGLGAARAGRHRRRRSRAPSCSA